MKFIALILQCFLSRKAFKPMGKNTFSNIQTPLHASCAGFPKSQPISLHSFAPARSAPKSAWLLALLAAAFAYPSMAQQAPIPTHQALEADTSMSFEPAPSLWRLQLSPYTQHFSQDDHHKNVLMAGVEREGPRADLAGLVLFTNSFGQPSAFIYPWGRAYHGAGGLESLSLKWSAGLLYGYTGSYSNKVPLNYHGFSPGLILALDYKIAPKTSAQVNLLGTAALMFQVNISQ